MPDETHSRFDFTPLAAAYDGWYETPEGRAHDTAQQAAVLRFLPPVRPGVRLLDVGCGTGHWSRHFASRGYEVLGLDICPAMIEVARSQRTPRCHFEVGDACGLRASAPTYRVVACMVALEFVSDPEAAVAGMVRAVASPGLVIVGTLNRLAPLNRDRVASGRQPYASAHLFSPGELHGLLRRYGRVRLAAAGPAVMGRVRGPVGAFWERLLLTRGRSQAPFIVAAVWL